MLIIKTTGLKTAEASTNGSIKKKGDRVSFIFHEDEDGIDYGYGTISGEKDKDTALVLVILKGRRKEIRDTLEIPYSKLSPHIPEVEKTLKVGV